MVSAAAVKEIDPRIDVAIETVKGTETGNATVSGTGTTGTTETAAENAPTIRMMATTVIPRTRGSRGSDPMRVARNRPSQHHHRPPVYLHPLRLWLTVLAAETVLENRTAGMVTDPDVLVTLGMTSTTHGTEGTGSVVALQVLHRGKYYSSAVLL